MRQNPLLSAFLVLLNIAAVIFAVYLATDALDQSRLQSARTEQSMNRLSQTLDKLGERLNALPEAAAAMAAARSAVSKPGDHLNALPGITPLKRSPAPHNEFANDNLRDPSAEDGGAIVSRAISLPGGLNLITNNEATLSSITSLVMDSLADRNADDLTRFEPQLAKSWDVSDDGLVYTIHLRDNAMWQPYVDPVTKKEVPAKPVTSRDFLFYWNTIQNTEIPCEHIRTYYEDLEGIEIIDDLTFKVVWKRPYSMSETFTLGLSPLPEHYYRPDPTWDDSKFAEEFISSPRNQWLIGTGPYKLTKWDKNTEVLLERDENYYGRPPFIKTRRLKVIPDHSVSFLEFKRNELDVYGLQPTQWHEETPEPEFRLVTPSIETANEDSVAWDEKKKAGELPENYQFEKFQYNSTSWSYIGYNMQKPLFQDRQVRLALTYLVDRERILDEVYMGLGSIISGPFIPQSPYYNHAVEPYPFDIEKAKAILAEAGWTDSDGDGILDKDYDNSGERKPFRFTFMIPSSSTTTRKIAAIMEQDMIKAKIKVDIKPIEWSVYTQLLDKREYDVCSLGWVGGVEGDPYQIWHGSGANREGSSNHVAYNSEEANRLIEEGRRTVDKDKRYKIYQRLHEVIAHDQPYTFLVAPTATLAQSKRFRSAIVYKGGQMNSMLQWVPRTMQMTR